MNSERLKRTEHAVEAYRTQIDTRKPEKYGFASMAAVPYAHIVAQLLKNKRPKGAEISLAPNPKDIVSGVILCFWCAILIVTCIGMGKLEQVFSRVGTEEDDGLVPTHHNRLSQHRPSLRALHPRQLVLCAYHTFLFPALFLIVYAKIASFVPFLEKWSKGSPVSFNFISGVLPPAVSAIFGFFLPHMMRWLSRYQGALTQSRLDRAVLARYFAFLVISQLIIFTLIGVAFST
jgi:hypothetical protein